MIKPDLKLHKPNNSKLFLWKLHLLNWHLHLGESQKTTEVKYRGIALIVFRIWSYVSQRVFICFWVAPTLQMPLLPLLFMFKCSLLCFPSSLYPPLPKLRVRGATVPPDVAFAARPACFLIPAPWPQPWPAAAFHHHINYSLMIQKQTWAEHPVSDTSQSPVLR